MGINVKTVTSKLGTDVEAPAKLVGPGTLDWNILNYEANIKRIKAGMEASETHINEQINHFFEIYNKQKETEEMILTQVPESSKDPIFKLYESSVEAYNNLLRIITYLDLEMTVTTNAIDRLEVLLLDSKQYGYLKQQADGELAVLKNIKEHLLGVIDKLSASYSVEREKIEKLEKRMKEFDEKLLKAQESQNPEDQKRLSSFEDRLSNLESVKDTNKGENIEKEEKDDEETDKDADSSEDDEDDEDDN